MSNSQKILRFVYLSQDAAPEEMPVTDSLRREKFGHFPAIVFVPTIDILITALYLPNLKNIKADNTEPLLYAIENQLSEDIDNIDLVLLHTDKTQAKHTVAVYDKSLARAWFEKLEALHYLPSIVLPDIFMLPFDANHPQCWSLFFTEHTVLVRTGLYEGFSVDKENLILYFEKILNISEETVLPGSSFAPLSKPVSCRLFNTQKDNTDFAKLKGNIDIIAEEKNKNISLLELAVQEGGALPDINLLEHHAENVFFSRSQDLKKWILSGVLFLVLLILMTVSLVSEYAYSHFQKVKLDQQISELYFKLYPKAQDITSPKSRMQQDLKLSKNPQDSFWGGLLKIGPCLEKEPKAALGNMRYDNHQFQLLITGEGVETLEKLNNCFKNDGLEVSGVSIVSTGEAVSETLTLKYKEKNNA